MTGDKAAAKVFDKSPDSINTDTSANPLNREARELTFGKMATGDHILQSHAKKAGDNPVELSTTFTQFRDKHQEALRPHYKNVDKALESFFARKDLPDGDKIKILGDLNDIIEGNGLENKHMDDPERRKLAVAGLIDNLGYPHWIDQGAHDTCAFVSNEERIYAGQGGDDTDTVKNIVGKLKEIVLKGTAKAFVSYEDKTYSKALKADDFVPDLEAKADQGKNDHRNYASQLWQLGMIRNVHLARSVFRDGERAPIFSGWHQGDTGSRLQEIAQHLEQKPVDISVRPDSVFNSLYTGSKPYGKIVGHSMSLYRQRDGDGNGVFNAEGKPLYFLSNQAGKNLDIKDLTLDDLSLNFDRWKRDSSLPSIFKSGPVTESLIPRYEATKERWRMMQARKRQGVGKLEQKARREDDYNVQLSIDDLPLEPPPNPK